MQQHQLMLMQQMQPPQILLRQRPVVARETGGSEEDGEEEDEDGQPLLLNPLAVRASGRGGVELLSSPAPPLDLRQVEAMLAPDQADAMAAAFWIDGKVSITVPHSATLPFRAAYAMGWALRIVAQLGSERNGNITHRQSKCSGVLCCRVCGYVARPYVAKVHRQNRNECRGSCLSRGEVVEMDHVECHAKITWSRDRSGNVVIHCDRTHEHERPPPLKLGVG